MATIDFTVISGGQKHPLSVPLIRGVIAGWTGRDLEALEKHIKELEELGVARPASVPIFYRVAASRFSTTTAIEATGEESSGEVEYALVQHNGTLYVGVGSDHTDRKVETYSVTASKQMCEKPLAATLWPFDEVKGHWDKLILRSWACAHGTKVLYQEGLTSTIGASLHVLVLRKLRAVSAGVQSPIRLWGRRQTFINAGRTSRTNRSRVRSDCAWLSVPKASWSSTQLTPDSAMWRRSASITSAGVPAISEPFTACA